MSDDRRRLGETGQVYVTLAAAKTYAESERLQIEEARRELTEIVLEARPSGRDSQSWRARSRTTGIDVSATIVREGPLLVVVSIGVRSYGRRA